MSKSTPINQLPNILLNDPQRQVQQSAPVEVAPQQPLQDPEEIIQETLNQLNAQVNAQSQLNNQPTMPSQAQVMQQQQTLPHPTLEQYYGEMPPPTYDYAMTSSMPYDGRNTDTVDMKTRLLKDLTIWNTDVQVAIFAAAFYIVISMLPVEKLLYRYIALDKIPYSGIVFKAMLMFTLIIILLKLLKD